ncbi:MAG: tetratricopeptide repeat protein [Bacteroidetes bacterium]|nr:tetratricopeptide repeat protein [Bacteroidota bacterium]
MTKQLKHLITFFVLLMVMLDATLIAQPDALRTNNNKIEKAGDNLLDQLTEGEDDIESVRKYYEKILEEDSTNYDALTNLGVIYQYAGGRENMEKSLGYFEKAVKFHPQKARAYHNLGILNSIIGNLDEGVNNLNKAAELDSKSPNSIRQLGIIYLQNEKLNEAIESFNRALERNDKDTESYVGKSLAYWLLKDYDNVIAVISEMQLLGLRFSRMELLLADVYFKKKDYEKAIRYAKIDEEENSAQAEGHYLLGQLYKIKNEKDKSEFEFEEVTEIRQQNPKASLGLTINIFFDATLR